MLLRSLFYFFDRFRVLRAIVVDIMIFVKLFQISLFRAFALHFLEIKGGLVFGYAKLLLGWLGRGSFLVFNLFGSFNSDQQLNEAFFEQSLHLIWLDPMLLKK